MKYSKQEIIIDERPVKITLKGDFRMTTIHKIEKAFSTTFESMA